MLWLCLVQTPAEVTWKPWRVSSSWRSRSPYRARRFLAVRFRSHISALVLSETHRTSLLFHAGPRATASTRKVNSSQMAMMSSPSPKTALKGSITSFTSIAPYTPAVQSAAPILNSVASPPV